MRLSLARDEALQAVRKASLAEPSTAWAERIRARVRRGERVPTISRQYAEEVLGEMLTREPGEDG